MLSDTHFCAFQISLLDFQYYSCYLPIPFLPTSRHLVKPLFTVQLDVQAKANRIRVKRVPDLQSSCSAS
jgi:hypothetical protein